MNIIVLLIQLAYIIPSIALYLIIEVYLARAIYNKDPEFTTAFHTLFLLRAPVDIVQVLISVTAFRFPLLNWQFVLHVPWLAKAGFIVSHFTCLLELCCQLLLSANRLTAIAFPLSHNRWWTPRSTCTMFFISFLLCLLPVSVRLPQEAGYIQLEDKLVPRLMDPEYQQLNSVISCSIYTAFCVVCLALNLISICVLSRQRREKLFDQQQAMTLRVQTNLLIYSCCFTLGIIAMTVFQFILAIEKSPLTSTWFPYVVLCLSVSADVVALCNPWLLLCLSAPFRWNGVNFFGNRRWLSYSGATRPSRPIESTSRF